MKKLKLLCWLLVMALCLAACSGQVPDDTTLDATTTTTPQATTETTTVATEEPRISMVESTDPIKNIILIIGDGMGLQHIKAGQLYDGKEYNFTKWQSVPINTASMTYSGEISPNATDSAASATAMATGHLTVNSYLAMLPDGTQLQTILDVAGAMGKATGIVTTDSLLGATPSGFSAHSRSRSADSIILSTQIDSGVNLLCGNYDKDCAAMAQEIQKKGYAYCEDYTQLSDTFGGDKAYWQLPLVGDKGEFNLVDVSIDALNYLDRDADGFVLMLEQGHPDKYSHSKDFLNTCKAVSNLNSTLEAILDWLGDRTDTAILVVADHETGGLLVSDQPEYANPENVTVDGVSKTLFYEYRAGGHTSTNVALFVYGITADFTKSEHYMEDALKNAGIYYLMLDILNIG